MKHYMHIVPVAIPTHYLAQVLSLITHEVDGGEHNGTDRSHNAHHILVPVPVCHLQEVLDLITHVDDHEDHNGASRHIDEIHARGHVDPHLSEEHAPSAHPVPAH